MPLKEKLKLPKGFTAHDGKTCPVDPEQLVELLIRTADGPGLAETTKAKWHQWNYDAFDEYEGLGEVLAYRVISA